MFVMSTFNLRVTFSLGTNTDPEALNTMCLKLGAG